MGPSPSISAEWRLLVVSAVYSGGCSGGCWGFSTMSTAALCVLVCVCEPAVAAIHRHSGQLMQLLVEICHSMRLDHRLKYFWRFLIFSKTFPGFSALGEQNCLLLFKAFIYSKQFCSPRVGNPGNVLLTSRNLQKYFYQWYYNTVVFWRKLKRLLRLCRHSWLRVVICFWSYP